jgi:hypothetical protein
MTLEIRSARLVGYAGGSSVYCFLFHNSRNSFAVSGTSRGHGPKSAGSFLPIAIWREKLQADSGQIVMQRLAVDDSHL